MSDSTGGLSGVAGYALGRMSAENDRVLMNAVAAFKRRRQAENTITVDDYNALADENARLSRALADTREAFYKLEEIYDELRAWSKDASATMKVHGLIKS